MMHATDRIGEFDVLIHPHLPLQPVFTSPRPVGGTHIRNDCQSCGGALSRRYGEYFTVIAREELSSALEDPLPMLSDPFVQNSYVETETVCGVCYYGGFEP